jgi:hypothetical protein
MRKATYDVVKPDPGVKNEEHVAREERDREKWPGPFFQKGLRLRRLG